MVKQHNIVVRPVVMALLVAGAFGAQAADRQVMKDLSANTLAQPAFQGSALQAERSITYPNGLVVTRHQQTFQGIPVWNEAVVEHVAKDGKREVVGAMLRNLDQDLPSVTPIFNRMQALMQAQTQAQIFDIENQQVKMYVKREANNTVRLIYVVSFNAKNTEEPRRPFYMLDANTGAVIDHWEGINHANGTGPGGNAKTGQYEFGTKYGYLNVTQSGSTCSLNSTNVATYNMNSLSTTPKAPHSFTCPRNTVKAINGAYAPMNDAHYFGNVVFNMYQAWAGVRPCESGLIFGIPLRAVFGQ
jgi:Zn-dependent metalloprotease